MKRFLFTGGLAIVLLAVRIEAHHSFAATYFEDKTTQIEGKLVQFQFRNPHSFMQVEVKDAKGEVDAGPSNGAARLSWEARASRVKRSSTEISSPSTETRDALRRTIAFDAMAAPQV
jgi:hypothetical protein